MRERAALRLSARARLDRGSIALLLQRDDKRVGEGRCLGTADDARLAIGQPPTKAVDERMIIGRALCRGQENEQPKQTEVARCHL